jgi:lactosylceramide 4-alpha-galactosyltransferase
MTEKEKDKIDIKSISCWIFRQKMTTFFIALFLIMFLVYHMKFASFDYEYVWKEKSDDLRDGFLIPANILQASKKPQFDGNSIFFIAPPPNQNKTFEFTSRQACSIEAAGKEFRFYNHSLKCRNNLFERNKSQNISYLSAKTNPNQDIFVLFPYKVSFINVTSQPILAALSSFKNIYFNILDIVEYAENTPLENLIQDEKLKRSSFKHEILKFLTLWKYTGTYVDMDVIIRKNVDIIGANFACFQEDGLISSDIISIGSLLGRKLADKILVEIIASVNGYSNIVESHKIFSDTIKSNCNTSDYRSMHRENCSGFEVLPSKECYAINYNDWRKFFDERFTNKILNVTSESFAIDFWGFLSDSIKLPTNSDSAYIKIAKEFCPRTLKASGEVFS